MSSISQKKKFIYNDIVKRLENKGGKNFSSLSSQDVKFLFKLYDMYFFKGKIHQKLTEKMSGINFQVSRRTSGVIGKVGMKGEFQYFIEIAPRLVAQLCGTSNKEKIKKIIRSRSIDRVICLQLVMEYNIIYLIMILYEYLYKEKHYSENGKLFQCMLKKFFGYTQVDPTLQIAYPQVDKFEGKYIAPKLKSSPIYTYYNNSCSLDSLLTVLFLGSSSCIRNILFNTNVKEIDYKKPTEKGTKNFFKICKSGSKIETEEQTKKFTEKLQRRLKFDYNRMTRQKENMMCSNIRNLLKKCLPDMMERHRWAFYPAYEVYTLLAELFPNLALKNVPYCLIQENGTTQNRKEKQPLSTLQVTEFLESGDSEYPVKKYLFNKFKYPFIVFNNDSSVKRLNSLRPERIPAYGYIPEGKGRIGNYNQIVEKKRVLGEYIINDRYRLFGVIVLEGVVPNVLDSGTHFTSYIRGKDLQWYFYNDMEPKLIKIPKLPKVGVFIESNERRPALFFYELIN